MNIRIACLAAALAQILWSLLIVDPQAFGTSGAHGFDWTGGLMFLESLVLLIFFLAASWSSKRFIGSVKVKYAALIVALCLAVENLRPPYGMLRGIVRSSVDSLAWRYYPFIQARRILVAAIPSLAVVSIVIFLLVVWHASPRSEGLGRPLSESRRRPSVLGVAALLAFTATIVAVGQLIFAVTSGPIWHTPGFAVKFALRLLSLGSLAVFFLLVKQSQNLESIGTSELSEQTPD